MFSIYVILPAAPGLGDYSASNRNEYQKKKKKKKNNIFLENRARLDRRNDNVTIIYKPIVLIMCHNVALLSGL
jgi:hypothetical protein